MTLPKLLYWVLFGILIALNGVLFFLLDEYRHRNAAEVMLFVELVSDEDDKFAPDANGLSGEGLVKHYAFLSRFEKRLENGGQIGLSVDIARTVDKDFDRKFTIVDADGMFLTRPALLNFVGDFGWEFSQFLGGQYVFTKRVGSRE